DGGRVVLALGDLVIDVRSFVGPVLRDDHAGADQRAALLVLEDEQILAVEGILDLAEEAPRRPVDQADQSFFVVRHVDGVEHRREALEPRQIVSLYVPQDQHTKGASIHQTVVLNVLAWLPRRSKRFSSAGRGTGVRRSSGGSSSTRRSRSSESRR